MDQPQFPGMNPNTGNPASLVGVQQKLVQRAFVWMFVGLLLTALVSFFLGPNVPYALVANNTALWVIIGVQFLLLLIFGPLARRASATVATFLFFLYAALEGVIFTLFLAAFGLQTVGVAFLIAAGMFGLSAVYGYVTKADLTKIGSIALMGLFGLFLATLVNIFFLESHPLQLIVSYIAVVLFTVVTAFDVQQLKYLGEQAMDEETATKYAIFGALMLYLDFMGILKNLIYILGSDD